jgi:hypothetical protein
MVVKGWGGGGDGCQGGGGGVLERESAVPPHARLVSIRVPPDQNLNLLLFFIFWQLHQRNSLQCCHSGVGGIV